MKALVIGGGGREHALAWRLKRSDSIDCVYATPGNAGMALDASCIPADVGSPPELVALSQTLGGSPRPMYERYGFVPTGEIDDGEVVARLVIE